MTSPDAQTRRPIGEVSAVKSNARPEFGAAGRDGARAVILRVAADRLRKQPFVTVTLGDVAEDAGLPIGYVRRVFHDMHEVGSAVLDHERASMHMVQERLSGHPAGPLERVAIAFRLVGENLADDVIVRAGVRIAAESREHFPERRLDPFRTWDRFITPLLAQAQEEGQLRTGLDLDAVTWTIVAAGMGTKDLLSFHDTWAESADRLESTVRNILSLITGHEPGHGDGAGVA